MIATISWKNHAGSNKCVYGFFPKFQEQVLPGQLQYLLSLKC